MRFVLPVLALLAASAAVAQPENPPPAIPKVVRDGPVSPPVIDGPAEAKYQAAFTVTNLPAGAAVLWDVMPEVGETVEKECDGSIVISGPAGPYQLKARVVRWDAASSVIRTTTLKKTFRLTGNPQPQPVPPGPGPMPPPVPPTPTPPQPTGKISRLVFVEDTSKPGTWRGDLLGSAKVISWYKSVKGGATGPIHAIYDVTADASTLNAEGKKYVAAAVGKTLPYGWALDATGAVLKELSLPKTPDEFVTAFDVHPGERKLGLTIAAPKLAWGEFGADPTVPLIPRAQWKPMQLSAFLPPVHDQDGRGQCASSAACGVMEFARAQAGLSYTYLSAGDLYGRVNGGSDNGSMLEDNMSELQTRGVSPVSGSAPYVWSGRNYPGTDRDKYRLAEVYLCPSFDAAVSAILQGFGVEIGLVWGGNFTPDSKGWLPKRSSGSVGGHALFSYGVAVAADGTVGLVTRNSWGPSWGGSSDGSIDAGSCVIPETLFTGYIGGFYAVRAVTQTSPVGFRPNPFRRAERGSFALAF